MYSLHPNCCVYPSPSINSLPVELLSEIFNICALSPRDPDSIHSPPLISSQSVLVPLVLSSVNRRWRSAAISQASLWSNICVTPELLEWEANDKEGADLNTTPIRTYLSRSRNYPLNILIEGRDPDWDFSEQDVGIDFGNSASDPPFSSDNMEDALSVLLPHITRWRHLTILTDTWAPMYIALQLINPGIRQSGAPILESLSLRRCNDYVSYSRYFQPRHLNDIGFLTPKNSSNEQQAHTILPRLKYLHLHGVHADWDSLISALGASQSGLSFLGLASHSEEVRPSMSQFHKLLKSTPTLQTLSVVGTGPEGPGSEDDSAHNYESVCLPHLRDITVGYRSEPGGRSLLHFLDAPNAQSLVLEDTTYPADATDVNAGPILTYLGTKQCDGNEHLLPGVVVGTATEKRRKRSICVPHVDLEIEPQYRSALPGLQHVALRNVKSTFQPLATFFGSLTNVTHLELSGVSMLYIHALVPYSRSLSDDVPCPQLHSLTLKDFDFNIQDLNFIITRFSSCRQARGAPELQDLRFHIKSSRSRDVNLITAAASTSSPKIHIISDDFEFEDDLVVDEKAEAAAFFPGGAFNDPIFDAYYANSAVSPSL